MTLAQESFAKVVNALGYAVICVENQKSMNERLPHWAGYELGQPIAVCGISSESEWKAQIEILRPDAARIEKLPKAHSGWRPSLNRHFYYRVMTD